MEDTQGGVVGKGAITSRTILVVDDEPLVCDALQMMLAFDGHKVTAVYNAKDALSRLEQDAFDLVITDFAMPGMQGNELANRVKQMHPKMPIVMITAYAEMLDSKKDLLGCVDCLISKPFMMEDLRNAISTAISKY
jgi:CheY-like chemotaxis protein